MSPREWCLGLGVSVLLALFMLPWYSNISLWVGTGIIIACLSIFNIVFSARYIIPFPQLGILIACIQLILAAWGTHFFPSHHPFYDIQYHLPDYLAYAGPVCFFIAFGFLIPLICTKFRQANRNDEPIPTFHITRELHNIFVIGLVGTLLQPISPPALSFLAVLVANLIFVGAFGYALLEIPGWKVRVGIAYFLAFPEIFNVGGRPRPSSLELIFYASIGILPTLEQATYIYCHYSWDDRCFIYIKYQGTIS